MIDLTFTLNGTSREVQVHPEESLLDCLRERCGIISTKDGCQPQGQCGCCLALIDGVPRVTCATPASKCEGSFREIGASLRGGRQKPTDRIPRPPPGETP